MPSCVEGEAAQKALGLRHTRSWRGGERPVSQETPGHHGLLAANAAASAGRGPTGGAPAPAAGRPGLSQRR